MIMCSCKTQLYKLCVLTLSVCNVANAQREIQPLHLDKLNRDSLNSVIQQKEREKDYKALGKLYGGIYTYYFESNVDSALMYAQKAEAYSYKAGDSSAYYFIEAKLGELSSNVHNLTIANEYYKKALNYYTRTKNYKMLFHEYGGLAHVYELQGDSLRAFKYESLAIEANKKGKDTLGEVILNNERIKALIANKKLDESIVLLKTNIALIKSAAILGYDEMIRAYWLKLQLAILGECYYQKEDYKSAIKYSNEFTSVTTEGISDINILRTHVLIKSYINLNEKDSAIKYIDTLFKESAKNLEKFDPKKLIEISAKYETAKKQRQIAELQEKNYLQQITVSTQRKLNIAFISIFFLAVISAYLIIKNNQHKRKIQAQLEKQKSELAKKHAVETERYRISSELHDDLGGGLSTIRLISEMVKQGTISSDTDKQLDKISESSKELVQKMNEIVWALNVNNDTLQSLIGYMRRYAVKYLDDVGINCAFIQLNEIPQTEVDGTTRRNIFLLIKEALNNVVKHAQAAAVDIVVEVNAQLQITVHDNGKGIANEMLQNKTGNGLRNMQQRAKDMEGSMEIKNHDGTTVLFTLPFIKNNTKG
jgi:signal transduction histidine kinase